MSSDREFDMALGELLETSQRNAARWSDDPEWTDEFWVQHTTQRARRIYRLGARAQMNRSGDLDPLDRLRWVADQDFRQDLQTLLAEVERAREQREALTGLHGVTESDITSMLAEGFHTAFRKAADSMEATVIHKMIRDMPSEDWSAVIDSSRSR